MCYLSLWCFIHCSVIVTIEILEPFIFNEIMYTLKLSNYMVLTCYCVFVEGERSFNALAIFKNMFSKKNIDLKVTMMSAWNMIESQVYWSIYSLMAFQLRAQTDLEPIIPNSFLYINICIGFDLVLLLLLFSFIHIVKLSDIHT